MKWNVLIVMKVRLFNKNNNNDIETNEFYEEKLKRHDMIK